MKQFCMSLVAGRVDFEDGAAVGLAGAAGYENFVGVSFSKNGADIPAPKITIA